MRLRLLAQVEQVGVLGNEVLGQVLGLLEMWRERRGCQGGVQEGERLEEGLVFKGAVQVLRSMPCTSEPRPEAGNWGGAYGLSSSTSGSQCCDGSGGGGLDP